MTSQVPIRFGMGIAIRLPSAELSMYMASPGVADPKVMLRGRDQPNIPLLQFDRCVFRFQPATHSVTAASSVAGRKNDNARDRSALVYGRVVHLVHVYSGLFVTIVRKPSESNSSNYCVSLLMHEDAGSACRFRILPRYKIRSEGDHVCDKDVVYIQQETGALGLQGAPGVVGGGSPSPTKNQHSPPHSFIPGPNQQQQQHSNHMQSEEIQTEVTASDLPTTFELSIYDSSAEDDSNGEERHPTLVAGTASILFHRERDAILTIPTAISESVFGSPRHSAAKRPITPVGTPRRTTSGSNTAGTTGSPGAAGLDSSGGNPNDAATLLGRRIVPYFRHNETPVATLSLDALEYGSNALWLWENIDPTVGGPIPVGAPIRLRHGATGKYLVAVRSPYNGLYEMFLHDLSSPEYLEASVFQLDLVASSVDSPHIHSEKSFLRAKHYASGAFLSTAREGPNSSSLWLTNESNLEDTLAVIIVPKKEQQSLSFLIGNVEFLSLYIKKFYAMQKPRSGLTPRDSAIVRVVQSVTASLSALIRFCTCSDDEDPLTREGLPIPANQQSMFEVNLHKTAMEVLLCPFVASSKENKMELPLTGGAMKMEDVLLPENAAIHMVCRLCYRLLKQMSKGGQFAALLVDYVAFMQAQEGYKLHVADTLMEIFTNNPNLPPARMETDIRHFVHLLLTKGRSSGYIKFLSRLCCINDSGILSNQRLVCRLVLGQHIEAIVLKTKVSGGHISIQVPVVKEKKKKESKEGDPAPPEKKEKKDKADKDKEKDGSDVTPPVWIPLAQFLTTGDPKLVKFYESTIEMLGTLCVGGDPQCLAFVETVIPEDHIVLAIDPSFTASHTLRASYFRLALHLYIRRMLHAAQGAEDEPEFLCGSLVLPRNVADAYDERQAKNDRPSGSSRSGGTLATAAAAAASGASHESMLLLSNASFARTVRSVDPIASTPSLSLEDIANFIGCIKQRSLATLRLHRQTSSAAGVTDLISSIGAIWHAVVSHKQYTTEELKQLSLTVVGVLDGRTDKVSSESRYELNEETAQIMTTKMSLCSLLTSVLRGETERIASIIVRRMAEGDTPEVAIPLGEEMLASLNKDVLLQRDLFPVLLDLLNYENTELVSCAMDLLVSVCNAGPTIGRCVLKAEVVCSPLAVRAFRLFAAASASLLRNTSVTGTTMNEEGLATTVERLLRLAHDVEAAAVAKEADEERREQQTLRTDPHSATGKFKRSVGTMIAFRRVLGSVQDRRSRWREAPSTSEYARLLFCSGCHVPLLRTLHAAASSGSKLQQVVMQFFRLLSSCPEGCAELAKHVDVFVRALRDTRVSSEATVVLLRLLRVDKALPLSLEDETIVQLVAQLTVSGDPFVAEGLEHVVLGEFPIARNQRLVLSLLINGGHLRSVTAVSRDWSAQQLAVNSAVVDLVACCCVGNAQCRSTATKLLRAEDIMRVLVADMLPPAHMVPYFKFLCSAFLSSEDEWTAQELANTRKQWTENALWWSLVSSVMLPRLVVTDMSPLTETNAELVFGGILPALTCYYHNQYSAAVAQKSKVVVSFVDVCRRLCGFTMSLFDANVIDIVPDAYIGALQFGLNALKMHADLMNAMELQKTLLDASQQLVAGTGTKLSAANALSNGSMIAAPGAANNSNNGGAENEARTEQRTPTSTPTSGTQMGSWPRSRRSTNIPEETDMDSPWKTRNIVGAEEVAARWEFYSAQTLGPLIDLFCGGRPIENVPTTRPDLHQLHAKVVQHLVRRDLSEMSTIGAMATLRFSIRASEKEDDDTSLANAQCYVNSIGALRMVTEVLNHNSEEVRFEATALAIAILEGGNTQVQDQLLAYFIANDERFFHEIESLVVEAINQVKQQRAREIHGTFYSRTTRAKLNFRSIEPVFRFLQLMCEGHHLGLQEYLRDQRDNLKSCNVIKDVCAFLPELLNEDAELEHSGLLLQTLALLTEMCQGPCVGNQKHLVSLGLCSVLNKLLASPTFAIIGTDFTAPRNEILLKAKRSTVTCVLALLEGCIDDQIALVVLAEIPMSGLESLLAQLAEAKEFRDGSLEDLCELVYSTIILLHTLVQCVENKTNKDRVTAEALLARYSGHVGMLGIIEIERNERIEKVYFRVPTICSMLSEETKQKLLWGVDRSTQGSKLSDFLDKADELIYDMEAAHRVTEGLHNYRIMNFFTKLPLNTWDDISIFVAGVLNLLFLVVISDARGLMDRTTDWTGVEGLIRVLAYFQTFVSVLTALLDSCFTFPVILYKQSKEISNPTLLQKASALLARPTTLYRISTVIVSVAGFAFSDFFFAYHLIALIGKSNVLKNVVVAVTQNGKSLLLTAMLGCIFVYFFSIIGFVFFQEHFKKACSTLSQCVVHILSTGLRQGGGIGDAMEEVVHGDELYHWRLVYDIMFWAFMIVIFLNILFGIIIDTFAELRDEKSKKEEDMHSKCFVCGIDSYTFDRYAEGFQKHVKEEHNMWQYLYFLHHLRRKDKDEYTGQESYVSDMVAAGDIGFFPAGKCSSLRDHRSLEGGEKNGGAGESEGKSGGGQLRAITGGGGSGGSGGIVSVGGAALSAGGAGGANGPQLLSRAASMRGFDLGSMMDNGTLTPRGSSGDLRALGEFDSGLLSRILSKLDGIERAQQQQATLAAQSSVVARLRGNLHQTGAPSSAASGAVPPVAASAAATLLSAVRGGAARAPTTATATAPAAVATAPSTGVVIPRLDLGATRGSGSPVRVNSSAVNTPTSPVPAITVASIGGVDHTPWIPTGGLAGAHAAAQQAHAAQCHAESLLRAAREELAAEREAHKTALRQVEREVQREYFGRCSAAILGHLSDVLCAYDDGLVVRLGMLTDGAFAVATALATECRRLRHENSLLTIEIDGMRALRDEGVVLGGRAVTPSFGYAVTDETGDPYGDPLTPAGAGGDARAAAYTEKLQELMLQGQGYMELLTHCVSVGRDAVSRNGSRGSASGDDGEYAPGPLTMDVSVEPPSTGGGSELDLAALGRADG